VKYLASFPLLTSFFVSRPSFSDLCQTEFEPRWGLPGHFVRRSAHLGPFPQHSGLYCAIEHASRLAQVRAPVKRKMGRSFPIFLSAQCHLQDSMPDSECCTRFRMLVSRPAGNAFLLKINLFPLAPLPREWAAQSPCSWDSAAFRHRILVQAH